MNTIKLAQTFSFVAKFLLLFCLFYFGTILVISLAAPGGLYSQFVHDYLDYVSWLKISYEKGASWIAGLFGYTTSEEDGFLIRVIGGRGVIVAYDCVGYGVMSFWAAFVISYPGKKKSRLIWLVLGLFILWLINTTRIGLFLVAINKKWDMPLGFDHHTWFNIFAYGAIFMMMYFYDKSGEIGK